MHDDDLFEPEEDAELDDDLDAEDLEDFADEEEEMM
jgi:hypothetical protein